MNTPLNERLSESIVKTQALLHDELVEYLRERVRWRDETEALIRDQMDEYKQYLLTLDPDMLSNIMDLCEDGSVFVTHPVEIRDMHDIVLTHRGDNILCRSPDLANAYPLFAVPDGKYRFVLIAIPVEDDDHA